MNAQGNEPVPMAMPIRPAEKRPRKSKAPRGQVLPFEPSHSHGWNHPDRNLFAESAAMHASIEATVRSLEPTAPEFNELVADAGAYHARAQALFAEDVFRAWRFTKDDIRCAFGQVGMPGNDLRDEENDAMITKAILFLANKKRQEELSVSLLLLMQDYAAQHRFMDAWLLYDSAVNMMEEPSDPSPFLVSMFYHGYDEWIADERDRHSAFVAGMGLTEDVVRNMRPDEFGEWMNTQLADPGKRAAIEKWLENNPELNGILEQAEEARSEDICKLLEHEDTHLLRLSEAEVEPWLSMLDDRIATAATKIRHAHGSKAWKKAISERLEKITMEVSTEMAASVFVAARVKQLSADLTAHRARFSPQRDGRLIRAIDAALMELQTGDDPAESLFLHGLCFLSIRLAVADVMGAE